MKIRELSEHFSYLFEENDEYDLLADRVARNLKTRNMLNGKIVFQNGKRKILYPINTYKYLNQTLVHLDKTHILELVKQFLSLLIQVDENDYLKKESLDIKFEHILFEEQSNSIMVIFVPIKGNYELEGNANWSDCFRNTVKIFLQSYFGSDTLSYQNFSTILFQKSDMEIVYDLSSYGWEYEKGIQTGYKQLYLQSIHKANPICFEIGTKEFVIGSMQEQVNGVILESTVSRKHCMLYGRENLFYIKDLNSTNGTKLNHRMLEPMKEYPLKQEDIVEIANINFVVKIG